MSTDRQERPAYHPARAERYVIPVTILYRTPGDPRCYSGVTENISSSGILFHAEHKLAPDTPIDLMLEVPAVISPLVAALTFHRGRVVRALPATGNGMRPAIAAMFIEAQAGAPPDPRRI